MSDPDAGGAAGALAPTAPAYPVRAADSALRVLLMFDDRSSLRLTDVARELNVSRSTAHRVLAVLVHRGFATHDARTRRYLPGGQLLRIGLAAVGALDLPERALPHLIWLRDQTGETTHLILLEGREARFVVGVEALRTLRGGVRDGQRAPSHTVSGGKVLLAHLDPHELAELYRTPPVAVTERSITDLSVLTAELDVIRERGFATNFGEHEDDLAGVGVAVWGPQGRPVAALAVAGPMTRVPESSIPDIALAARCAADRLSRELGGRPPGHDET